MNKCTECGSYAINHHCHGRDGSDPELCDVCYWRVRATDYAALEAECERLTDALDRQSVITGDYIARCQRLADERDALRAEISDLHTTMMAAAVEIHGHWAAHCDEEGYGPANLMHRLERGIASQYGYTARTLVMVESERDALRQQRDKLAELLREAKSAYTTAIHWTDMRATMALIDNALSELTP